MNNQRILRMYAVFAVLMFCISGFVPSTTTAKDIYDKGPIVVKDSPAKSDEDTKEGHDKAPAKTKEKKTKHKEKAKEGHEKASVSHETHGEHGAKGISAEDALKNLIDGNKRYVAGKSSHKRQDNVRRAALAKSQHPFAIILSCSDSRVPPEILFDQGLGDIFVIRTAGHVADDIAVGSIEYAVEHLGTRLIMVLGHERCGAVTAAVQGGEAPGQIGKIVAAIKPAVEKAKEKHGDLIDDSIKANSKMVAQKLGTSKPIMAEMVEDGVLKVVGAYYDLDSGEVTVTYNPCM